MDWKDFSDKVYGVYDAVNRRKVHKIEGWEENGFTVPMWRRSPNGSWLPMSELAETVRLMDEASARRFVERIEGDPALMTRRRMSPAEAWKAREAERVKFGPWAAPTLLGPKLAQRCKVSDRLEISYKDNLSRMSVSIYGVLDDGRVLDRGSECLVWVNPLNPGTAYITNPNGGYLGTARVVVPCRRGDIAGVERQMRVIRAAEADMRRKLAPIAASRQRDRLRDRRHNHAVLASAGGFEDPVGASGDGYSLAELAGAVTNEEPAQPVEKSFSLAERSSV